jgi:hypothetical protein
LNILSISSFVISIKLWNSITLLSLSTLYDNPKHFSYVDEFNSLDLLDPIFLKVMPLGYSLVLKDLNV